MADCLNLVKNFSHRKTEAGNHHWVIVLLVELPVIKVDASILRRHPTEGWPAMHSLIYDIWLVIPKPYENLSPIIASRFSEVISNGSCLETFWCGSCKQLWRLMIYVGTGVETNMYNSCLGFRLNISLLEDQILFQERATENGPWVMLNVKPF